MSYEVMKVVVFRCGDGEYGLLIKQVVSIERMQAVTPLLNMPEHVVGVVNLRGEVTPVVDLRHALGYDTASSDETQIIVVSSSDIQLGLIVNAATGILDIPQSAIQRPSTGLGTGGDFLLGICNLTEPLLVLLDVNKMLESITSLSHLRELKQMAEGHPSF